MPTTSNFGWTTPADTDLVKDGAAAIRTLGNGIDTSLIDLKGGTTGQILSKASNTDLDYTWITNDVGDITAVTAGTGISGGGTSGAVTITNSMATEITASGDIIVGTGSGTFDNLPIGTTGQVLTADTTVSPYKVKWATAATSSGPAFGATMSANQTGVAQNTYTKVNFNTETFDTDACYDPTTNYRFTPNKAGYYKIGMQAGLQQDSAFMYGALYLNGVLNAVNYITTNESAVPVSRLIYFNGTTDYVEAYIRLNGTGTRQIFSGEGSFFYGFFVRS